jgi:hypothetical protein
MGQTMADSERTAVQAVEALGRGFDFTNDFRLKFCKGNSRSRLVVLEEKKKRDIVIPGGPLIQNVSTDIKCDKGERTRYKSDILEFNQVP